MSPTPPAASPAAAARRIPRPLSRREGAVAALAAATLLGAELVFLGVITAWSLEGILGLPDGLAAIIGVGLTGGALVLAVRFWRNFRQAERRHQLDDGEPT